MDDPKIHEVFQWLVKAEHDIGSACRLISGDIPYLDTAVYHCQQAAEKSLKAYLTLKDTPFQKIHDLSFLVDCLISNFRNSTNKSIHPSFKIIPCPRP
jgi:HEPN domain-containing protein